MHSQRRSDFASHKNLGQVSISACLETITKKQSLLNLHGCINKGNGLDSVLADVNLSVIGTSSRLLFVSFTNT